MSECSKICILYADYLSSAEAYELVEVYASIDECLAGCDCVDNSSSENASSDSAIGGSSSVVSSDSSDSSASSEVIVSSSLELSSSSANGDIASSGSSELSSSSEIVSSASSELSSSSEIVSSSELSSSSEIVSSASSELSSSSTVSASAVSGSCTPCGPDLQNTCCAGPLFITDTQKAGWLVPPLPESNVETGSGSIFAVYKFEDSDNCCYKPSFTSSTSPTASLESCNNERQAGGAVCKLNFDVTKSVLLKIWGNTERQDAAYDISQIKITKEASGCPREFVIKKCAAGEYWIDCPSAALDSAYEQCCSPLLSLVGATDKGAWPADYTGEPELDYTQASEAAELISYYLHPNLTPECPKATTIGAGVAPELGTCDVEPTYWSNCPDAGGGGYVTPLAAWRRLSKLRRACQLGDSSSSDASGSSGAAANDPPAHFLADETYVRIYSIFHVVEPYAVFSSLTELEVAPEGGVIDKLYEAGGKGYFYINNQYEEIIGYDNTKVGWYARVNINYELHWYEYIDGLIWWGPVENKSIHYMAKLDCAANGKPIGSIPGPVAISSSSSPSQAYAFNCGGEFDAPIPPVGYALNEEFPTLFLYQPGTPSAPSTGGDKAPSAPGPEWCGGKTNGSPCATLGVECPGCEKLTGCPGREVIARTCISGTDENLGCLMGPAEMCRTFVIPPGEYQVHFETDTMDELYHVQMEHNFLVEWVNEEDGPIPCPPTPPTEPVYLFNKESWADTVPEPYKTYLDAAADRWAEQITFNKAVSVAIEGLYASLNKTWEGIELHTLYLTNTNTNQIAACGINQAVDLITSTSSVKFNATEFSLLINQAYNTTSNPSGCALTPSQWVDVLTHELGHAIGIGIFWQSSYAEMGALPPNGFFLSGTGYSEAQEGYNVITNLSRAQIPLEDAGGSGTASAHWENSFRPANYPDSGGLTYPGLVDELMIGVINTCNPALSLKISALSVGVAVDFGYQKVGPDAAEGVPQLNTTLPLMTAGANNQLHLECKLDIPQEIIGTIYLINPPSN